MAAEDAAYGRGEEGATEDLVRYLAASLWELIEFGEGPPHRPMEDEMIQIRCHVAAITATALLVHLGRVQGLDPDLTLDAGEYLGAMRELPTDLRNRFRAGGLPAFVAACGGGHA